MTTLPQDLTSLAEDVLHAYGVKDRMIATAESCTGGLIAATLTAVAGSSRVVERGFVTYTNQAKSELLGVDPDLFPKVGAVSREVAAAMAEGALRHAPVDAAVSVTGVAGPGQSEMKPAGLVYVGLCRRGAHPSVEEFRFDGDRDSVRHQTVVAALKALLRLIEEV